MAKKFFNSIRKQIALINKLDVDKQLTKIMNNGQMQSDIIDLNTNAQLYEKGIRADGTSLGEYTKNTIAIKEGKGQETGHVTLRDTGDFYASFKVKDTGEEVIITADTQKPDVDLADKYGENILGLTPESLAIVRAQVKLFLLADIRLQLSK